MDQYGFEYGLIFVLQQVVHDVQKGSIQVVVQTLLDQCLLVPVRQKEIVWLHLQQLVNLHDNLPALLLHFIGRVVQHVEDWRVLADFGVVQFSFLEGENKLLD